MDNPTKIGILLAGFIILVFGIVLITTIFLNAGVIYLIISQPTTPTPIPGAYFAGGGTGGGGYAGGTTPGTGLGAGRYDIPNRPFRGTANAPVTIVEYSDFQCPFCSRAAATMKQLMAENPGKIKLIYMNFPLPFHQNAQKAAEAAECAADQERFWEMHDKLFENQNALEVSNLKQYAADLGLDTQRFNTCLDSGQKAPVVQAQIGAGAAAGVAGTPTFFINGKEVVGVQPIEVFRQAVNEQLHPSGT